MKIIKTVQSFCQKNDFDLTDKSILVATSGGVDSLVLIDILLQHSYIEKIGIAHCNFSLRENESDEDEKFIKEYANQKNIPFHSIKFDTKKIAAESQKSIQLIARELRYNFFSKIGIENDYDYVATAHHLSDSLETSIYHLSKGTGIAGIRGILPQRIISSNSKNATDKIQIIRPLLCLTKEEILNYATQNNLKWREDSSNKTQKYKRNFIRHSIIPLLKEINPDTEKTFLNTSERLRSMEKLLQFHVEEFEKKILIREDKRQLIEVLAIKNLVEELLIVSEFLKTKGFSYKQSKQILKQIDDFTIDTKQQTETKNFISKTYILYTNKKEWILIPKDKSQSKNKLENKNKEFLISVDFTTFNETEKYTFEDKQEEIKLVLEKCNPEKADFKDNSMYLDLEKLKFPLVLRKWENGDKFVPLGMQNKKSVGDFLTDLKIPIYERNFVYVLISNNVIVWVGISKQNKIKGLRINNNFKLNKTTQISLKIC